MGLADCSIEWCWWSKNENKMHENWFVAKKQTFTTMKYTCYTRRYQIMLSYIMLIILLVNRSKDFHSTHIPLAFSPPPLCTQPTFYRSESDKSLIMSDLQIDTDHFGTILIQVWYNADTDLYYFRHKSRHYTDLNHTINLVWFCMKKVRICISIVSDLYQNSAKKVCIIL